MSIPRGLARSTDVYRNHGLRELLRRYAINGQVTLIKKFHRFRRKFVSDWQYIRLRLWRQSLIRQYRHLADPLKTIWISPDNIEFQSTPTRPDHYAIGAVKGGNWDRNRNKFEELYIFECFREHFVDGKRWERTDFIEDCLYGNRTWRGLECPEEIENRCVEMENLYSEINEEGFKPASELLNTNIETTIKSGGNATTNLKNILVDIGRDGQFLFVDGKHRLAIAKILNIDSIPVNVMVRHKQWQTIREEVGESEDVDELSDRARQHLDHPDLQELVPDE